ncbi:hypothetical protein [Leucobacter sp. cx-169]|uniref:hypothetical protein n=1 Tax=Leucobacter sp. cx-169 TaxID=2770549 RepID=UPI00165D8F89|nr:hypothetical protein [Leucobacter sp. cx-169]MBC9927336.1 hypothetical protein [Leucobacter sp. cx-169]
MTVFVNVDAATQNQKLGDLIAPIASLPEGDIGRRKLAEVAIRHLQDTDVLKKWSLSLARRYQLVDESSDVAQIVNLTVYEWLVGVTAPQVEKIRALYIPHLYGCARYAVMVYQESGARTGMTELTGVVRRKKQIVKGRAELRALTGEDATDAEVIEHVNERMIARRKDAARSGMILSEADFAPIDPLSTSERYEDGSEKFDMEDPAAEQPFIRAELDEAVRAFTSHLRDSYPGDKVLMRCAIAWMRCVFEGSTPGVMALCNATQCRKAEAKAALAIISEEVGVFAAAQREYA